MIDPRLLEVLVCPDTHQPVALAEEALIARVNAAIEAGEAKDVGGNQVSRALDQGLLREDGKILYPVRDDIPVMMVDDGIPVDGLPAASE